MDNKESGILILDADLVNTIVKEKHDLFIECFPGKEFKEFNFILLLQHLINKASKLYSIPIDEVILLHSSDQPISYSYPLDLFKRDGFRDLLAKHNIDQIVNFPMKIDIDKTVQYYDVFVQNQGYKRIFALIDNSKVTDTLFEFVEENSYRLCFLFDESDEIHVNPMLESINITSLLYLFLGFEVTQLSEDENKEEITGKGVLVKGVKHGVWKYYIGEDHLIAEGEYSQGKRIGKWFERENGEGEYLNGLKEGNWWKEIQESIDPNTLTTIHSSALLIDGNYVNGIKEGAWYEHGEKGIYINGLREGKWETFDNYDKLISVENYIKGKLVE